MNLYFRMPLGLRVKAKQTEAQKICHGDPKQQSLATLNVNTNPICTSIHCVPLSYTTTCVYEITVDIFITV